MKAVTNLWAYLSYGDAWPIAGAKNLAELAMQIANRIERLGQGRVDPIAS